MATQCDETCGLKMLSMTTCSTFHDQTLGGGGIHTERIRPSVLRFLQARYCIELPRTILSARVVNFLKASFPLYKTLTKL
jgi:hypothetical protein